MAKYINLEVNTTERGWAAHFNVREWTCPDCGEHHDRDIAAARNILMFATAGKAGIARGAGYTPSTAIAKVAAQGSL